MSSPLASFKALLRAPSISPVYVSAFTPLTLVLSFYVTASYIVSPLPIDIGFIFLLFGFLTSYYSEQKHLVKYIFIALVSFTASSGCLVFFDLLRPLCVELPLQIPCFVSNIALSDASIPLFVGICTVLPLLHTSASLLV